MSTLLTWHDALINEKQQPYFVNTLNTVADERRAGQTIYPLQKDVFNVFRYTELKNIKVVILGQDPYHGHGQAHGLAFSVRPGMAIPPSLLNIYKELANTIMSFTFPNHGYLKSWAHQGVFLLNTVLTVRVGQANSHANLGWEIFTNKVLSVINTYCKGVIFLLWGSHAQKREKIIDQERHHILKAAHPSPLSAHRGFFGCNHFALTNIWLEKQGKTPINWVPMIPDNTFMAHKICRTVSCYDLF